MFSDGDMFTFLDRQKDRIHQEIETGDMDDLIRKEPEKAVELLRDKYTLKLVKINWEKRDPERTIRDDVMEVSFHITFTGDPHLLQYRPRRYRMGSVPGIVDGQDRIAMVITGRLGKDDFQHEFERWQESLEFHLNSTNADADDFNRAMPTKIKSMIDVRAEQLRRADDEMGSMGFP